MRHKLVIFASIVSLTFGTAPDGFGQWIQSHGPTNGSVPCFAVSGPNLFVETDQRVVFLSTNDGTTWNPANNGLPYIYGVDAFATSSSKLIAATKGGGVYLSADNGTSWGSANTGLTGTDVSSLTMNDTNLFAGTQAGVFISTNNGTIWSAVNTGLTNINVHSLAAIASNLFAWTYGGGVFRSTNNAASWSPVNTGLTNDTVNAFAVSGTDLFAGTGSGVFISTDGGTSWIASTLINTHVNALLVSGTDLFAGTNQGVFLSTDDGRSWTTVNDGLSATSIYTLASNGATLFAGTSAGVWSRQVSEMIGSSTVGAHTQIAQNMAQAYPNPFNAKTAIRFSSTEQSFTQVSIVNLLGAEVARIFEGELEAGGQ